MTITISQAELAVYQRATDLAKDEIARLNTQVANLYDVIKQMRAEIDAERAARQRYDRIVYAARLVVSGPDSEHYSKLADAIDAYDRLVKGHG